MKMMMTVVMGMSVLGCVNVDGIGAGKKVGRNRKEHRGGGCGVK